MLNWFYAISFRIQNLEFIMLLTEIENYKNLDLLAKQVVEGFITGLHSSPFHGFSVEFAEHRHYNQGDNIRNIDWKLYGRTDKLFSKRYEEETNLRCRIVLDISPSMFYPQGRNDKLRFSVLAAASICNLLKKQRDAYGITGFDSEVRFQTEIRSNPKHLSEILSLLQPYWENKKLTEKQSGTQVTNTLNYIAQTTHKRSLVVIFTDMLQDNAGDEGIWQALQHIKFNKNEVILFHIQHRPDEANFEFESKPYRFVDLESGERIQLNPAEVKDEYVARMSAFEKQIIEKCLQYRIDFYPIDVSRDFHQVLLPFYVKRARM